MATSDSSAQQQEPSPWITPHDRRLMAPWVRDRIDTPGRDERFAVLENTDVIEFDWAGDGARHVGTVVHAWLHRLAGCGDPSRTLEQIDGVAAVSRRMLAQLGVGDAQLDGTTERVLEALNGAVAGEDASWIIGGTSREAHAELALSVVFEQRVQRIVIDRLVRAPDGVLWIIDYKTSRREGGDLAGFFANERRRYAGQLARYRSAIEQWYASEGWQIGPVRTGLYMTVYGALVPVE